MDSSLSKPVKIMISEQVALAEIFYLTSIFLQFNKNVLEWFLLIINKEYTLTRSTNLLSRSHPTLCYWLRRDAQYLLLTLWLKVQNRNSLSQMFFRIGVLKYFSGLTRKHLSWSLFLIKLQIFTPVTLLKSNSSTGVFLWILQKF